MSGENRPKKIVGSRNVMCIKTKYKNSVVGVIDREVGQPGTVLTPEML